MDSTHNPGFEEWSDRKCFYIASQDQFPVAVKDLNIQKDIISRYFNFYLGGKIQKGLSPRDLTLAVVAIMPISSSSEEFIWPQSYYSENGNLFFLTPDDRLRYDINNMFEKRSAETDKENVNLNDERVHIQVNPAVKPCMDEVIVDFTKDNYDDTGHGIEKEAKAKDTVKKTEETSDPREVDQENSTSEASCSKQVSSGITALHWYRLKGDEQTNITSTEETKYGPVENAKFCIAFNYLLDNWDVDARGRINLKYIFAMVALFVMRSKAKTFQNISKYFSNKIEGLNPYTTPHREFLKKSWKAFRETDHQNQIMFAKLVITSLYHTTRLDAHGKRNIIKYAVLSHTAYYGMGIISMLQQVAGFREHDFKFLFESLYSEETAVSWNRVNDFFKKYLNEEAKQHTFHWAGFIDSESVKHLTCSNNYELAVVIAVYIEKITEKSGVWQASWVAKGDLEKCKQLGYKMYDKYQEIKPLFELKQLEDIFNNLKK